MALKSNVIVASFVASFLGNYLATAFAIIISMPSPSEIAVVRSFGNWSPVAEWGGILVIVPFVVPPLYLVLRNLTRLPRWCAAIITFLVAWVFVTIVDSIVLSNLGHQVPLVNQIAQNIFRAGRLWMILGFGMIGESIGSMIPTHPPVKAHASRYRAFTLLEVLAVIAIITILAGILLSVFNGARKSAYSVSDAERMHQTYVAITLYEEDNQGEYPSSLIETQPFLKSKEVLRSQIDPFNSPVGASDYPADLYVFDSPVRSPYRISFSYLRAFVGRQLWPPSWTWETLRADPATGLLADKFYCPLSNAQNHQMPEAEHDFVRTVGPIYRILMDGSLQNARPADGDSVGGSINGLFLLR